MPTISRRKAAVTVVLKLLLAAGGCIGNSDVALMQPTSNDLRPAGYASRPASGPYSSPTTNANDYRGNVQQASYRAQFGGPGVDQGDVVEQPTFGEQGQPGMMQMPNLPIPTELAKSTAPPHRVAPPDTLYIEALRMVPRGPYKLEPLEVLAIEVSDTLPKQDIRGNFMITPEGTINLGFNYGLVRIGGLTVDQAQMAIRDHLNNILKNPTVNVSLLQMRGVQAVRGEHLVRPDGTIHLGMYGSVYVAGMNLGQIKCQIEKHLSVYLVDPQISVDVFAYNTRKIYIIADGGGYGQQVIALPATGNETVLDAVSRVQGLPPSSSQKRIWVARPSPAGHPCSIILPVDWMAITQAGRTETNYQLMPGDRIYISADPLITVYNTLDKFLAPIERVLGVTLLGANTYQAVRGTNTGFVVR